MRPEILDTVELSPDLEWMLQSGQVSDATLVEALAREFYAPLYRLALAALGRGHAAALAAQEALVLAVLSRHRYAADGVKAWVYAFAIDACRASGQGKRLLFAAGLASSDCPSRAKISS